MAECRELGGIYARRAFDLARPEPVTPGMLRIAAGGLADIVVGGMEARGASQAQIETAQRAAVASFLATVAEVQAAEAGVVGHA